ncbi:MAG: mechanosensitive ion channel family protein [bacterium]
MDNGLILTYIAIVTGALIIIYWPLKFWLGRTESRRIKYLRKRKNFEAVTTDTPVDDPNQRARDIGLESIETRFNFFRKTIFPILLFLWVILVTIPLLSFASATYISLILGTITVIIGIAARPVIENLISGFVISIGQPVRIGDTVLFEGQYGTIEDIALTYTVIKLWDWRRYVVPNNKFIQSDLINYSLFDKFIWANVEFNISLDADIEKVEQIAIKAMSTSNHCLKHESPSFWIMETGKESITCWVAGWAKTPSNAWELKHETRKGIMKSLREENIQGHLYHYKKKTAN